MLHKAKNNTERLILLIGSLGPLGLAPASGTVAVAVAGIPLFLLMQHMSLEWYVIVTLLLTAVSIWIHHLGDRILNEKDSGKLVLDELVGFAVAMAVVPIVGISATWQLIALAFFVERAIDILKIYPANLIERRLPGGWGVVGDDFVAGLYTLILLYLVHHFQPAWIGY